VLLEEDLPRQAAEKGDYLLPRMNALAKKYPKVMQSARGRGLMLGMEFVNHDLGYAVAKALFGRGILISGTYINARVLRVEPPLPIGYPVLDRFLAALEDSLGEVYRAERL
jgi:putrescine aminotransferase